NLEVKDGSPAAIISQESIHDSQIRNMNKQHSLHHEPTKNQGMQLTPGQTWTFLSQLGIGGCVDRDTMVSRIAEMEARDIATFADV
ncbi:hypothetical protein Ancab_029720, partial [Ancistrocladus abbreviatus]